jgi:hypothetical protein
MANKLRNFKFTIANQADVKDLFAISQDGTLYTHKGLDREVRDAYMLTIIAENTRIGARGGGLFQVKKKVCLDEFRFQKDFPRRNNLFT